MPNFADVNALTSPLTQGRELKQMRAAKTGAASCVAPHAGA